MIRLCFSHSCITGRRNKTFSAMYVLRLVLGFAVSWPLMADSQSNFTGSFTSPSPKSGGGDPATESPGTAAASLPPTPDMTAAPDPGFPTPAEPLSSSSGCTCDLTPNFCDIGCCCDVRDCGIANLSSIFNGCLQETSSGVCVESWLMFRANIDPELVTVTDTLFCVQSGNDAVAPETVPTPSETPYSAGSPNFSQLDVAAYRNPNSSFYKVDDIVLAYYNRTSVVSTLRQPAPGAASSDCVDRNPAKFLRSGWLFCSRPVTLQSCGRGSSLDARSFLTGLSLLRVPRLSVPNLVDLMVPVVPSSIPPEPSIHNGLCSNVVSKVQYVVTYTGAGEISGATVTVDVTNANLGSRILQQHGVEFQRVTPSPTPHSSLLVGLTVGAPVIGWFGEEAQPLTLPGLAYGGECSADPMNRDPILFTHNIISGCTFRSDSGNCSLLRSHLYTVLRGVACPDMVAMTGGSQPDWSRVVTETCGNSPAVEECETGCLLPVVLSIRVLWAQRGLLTMPQNHILGAKYRFRCQVVKCPVISPLPITTDVIFSDTTVLPEAPRAEPQPEWKFPFAFFTRGLEELDTE